MKRKRKAMSFTEHCKQFHKRPLRTAAPTERTSLSASVTLEAALVLPLFFFMMLNLLTVMSALRVQSALEAAVTEAGRNAAVHAFDLQFAASQLDALSGGGTQGGGSQSSTLQNAAEKVTAVLTLAYATDQVRGYMKEHCPDLSCVDGGIDGIDFMRSDWLASDGSIDLVAHYKVKPMIGFMSFMSFSMEARYCGHAWTGYQGSAQTGDREEEDDEIVFVTPHGTVYHKTPNCTYLKPSVRQVSGGNVGNLRNLDGGKYYPCESCGKGAACYVTDYGDRYHSDPGCKKISHEIIAIRKSEAGGRGCCSKCGGG